MQVFISCSSPSLLILEVCRPCVSSSGPPLEAIRLLASLRSLHRVQIYWPSNDFAWCLHCKQVGRLIQETVCLASRRDFCLLTCDWRRRGRQQLITLCEVVPICRRRLLGLLILLHLSTRQLLLGRRHTQFKPL